MIGSFRQLWAEWEAFWDEREHPISLALVRILLGACLLYDFMHIWLLDLVIPLFGVAEVGGFSDALMREDTPLLYRILPGTELVARGHHAVLVVAAFGVLTGFFTRTSCAVLVFAWAQFVEVQPYSDRGIDTLARMALVVLAFSGAGRMLAVDALIRTGSFWGDGRTIPAFARRLLILQLVVMYFGAGIQKVGLTWWPMGHYAALYFALQDPAVAAFDFSWIRNPPFFQLTQLGTAVTMVFQWSYPVVLLFYWWRRHPDRAGRFGRWAIGWRLEWVWIGIGGIFHFGLAVSMNLGIFPWAMLALYPVWIEPHEWLSIFRKVRIPVAVSDS